MKVKIFLQFLLVIVLSTSLVIFSFGSPISEIQDEEVVYQDEEVVYQDEEVVYQDEEVVYQDEEVVYQDEEVTIVAKVMSEEEADQLWQTMINERGQDAIPLPEDFYEQNPIQSRALKSYSASNNYLFDNLKSSVKLNVSATVNQTASNKIGTLTSARITINSNSSYKNKITYSTYDKQLLDGGRTYVIRYHIDVEQSRASYVGGYDNTWNDSGVIIFEIYASGTSYLY